MSHKRNFILKVVNSLVRESKIIRKPTQLTFHRDGGWADVRVAVPFNNHATTPSSYFKNEGLHQSLFQIGFENFVQDIYGLTEGETYYVYNIYLKEMYTKISYFIKENIKTPKELNEVTEKIKYSDAFLEKIIRYIKKRYPEVVDIKKDKHPWFKGWKEFIHVYVDEDDGQPTDIVQHPLEWKIHWDVTDTLLQGLDSSIDIRVTNLNKDTKLRGYTGEGINESYNIYDETIPSKEFIDKVAKKMVDKTEVNLYMSDYDPWTTHSPFFGNFITPQFPYDKRYKFNISYLKYESTSFIKYFGAELVNTYGFTTNGELKYFDSEYIKKLKEKVETLKIPLIKKRQKQKEEYNKKYNLSESRKDIKKEQDDIERAVQDLNRIHNFNVSYEDIVKEIKRSTPTKITDEIWGELQNTESNQIQFGDFNSVFNLSNKYNKSNPLKLKKKIEQNEYKYPIIVRFNDQYHLVSGNTRLCTAAAMGEYLDVIIADINKPYPVDENKKYKKNNV